MNSLFLKRWLISGLALLLALSTWPATGMATTPFSDIKGHFAAEEIRQLFEQGVVSGYKDGKFYPNRQVTRAEYLRMLLEIVPTQAWIQGPVPFEELSAHWAYNYLEQGYRSGIILETDWNLADPILDANVTRAEAVLLAATAMGLELRSDENPFRDLQKISTNQVNAILALHEAGIIKGMTQDTFGPEQLLTRGQVTKILILVQQQLRKQLEQRLQLHAEVIEVKGDAKIIVNKVIRMAKVGDVLPVGTEVKTGGGAQLTLRLSEGDTLYLDADTRMTIEELEISVQGEKPAQVTAQEYKILDESILLRGKSGESNIDLNWQTDKAVQSFSVFKARNESINTVGKPATKGAKSTQWSDLDIEPGNTYYYKVVGATGPQEGHGSKEVSFEVAKKASFKLWSGNVFAKVKSLFSASSKFEVQTPTTTAGVRGTSFTVSVKPDGSTDVGVYSGAVALGDVGASTNQSAVLIKPNEQATVAQKGQAPEMKPLQVAEQSNFVKQSLAKVMAQETAEQKQLEDKMKELQGKLNQKLEEAKQQIPQASTKLEAVRVHAQVQEPIKSTVEQTVKQQESQTLAKVYEQNKSVIDSAVSSQPATIPPSTSTGGGGSDSTEPSPAPTQPSPGTTEPEPSPVTATKTISGEVHLPYQLASDLRIHVYAEEFYDGIVGYSKGSHAGVAVTIPAGEKSTSYTLTVPVHEHIYAYQVRYMIHPSDYAGTSFIREGSYSLGGTSTIRSTPIDVKNHEVTGIDLTVLTGNTISGTITLPQAAPSGGLDMHFYADGSKGRGWANVQILEGQISIPYSLTVPPGENYSVSYYLNTNNSTYRYLPYGSTQLVSTLQGNVTGINFTLTEGYAIKGTVSLPVGETAPAGGLYVHLNAYPFSGNGGSGWANVVIPEGSNSTSYAVVLPMAAAQDYRLQYHVSPYNHEMYWINGMYPSLIFFSGNADTADIHVVLGSSTGYTSSISGVLKLPGNELAPAGGLTFRLHAYNNSSNSQSIYAVIPEGSNATTFSLDVAPGSGYRIHYSLLSTNTGPYLRNGNSDPYEVTGGDQVINDIIVDKGSIISGVISLPSGELAPSSGLFVQVLEDNGQDWTEVVIPAGQNSTSYTMAVTPSISGNAGPIIRYEIRDYIYNILGYRQTGYYNEYGTQENRERATFVVLDEMERSNINLELLLRSNNPPRVWVYDQEYPDGPGPWEMNLSQYFTDPEGQPITYSNVRSSNMEIVVPEIVMVNGTPILRMSKPVSDTLELGTTTITFNYSDGYYHRTVSFNFTLLDEEEFLGLEEEWLPELQ